MLKAPQQISAEHLLGARAAAHGSTGQVGGPHGMQAGRPGGGGVGRAAPAEVAEVQRSVASTGTHPEARWYGTCRAIRVDREGDARGTDMQQRPRASDLSGQEDGIVLTHAGAWERVLGQLGQPQGGRGAGSPGHLAGGPLRSVLARASLGCCAVKGVLERALAEGCPPRTPEHPRVPEKVQQLPHLPRKVGVCSEGALCGPDGRAKPLLQRGRLNGQSAEEVAGAGGTWSRQMGLGSRLEKPAQLSQEALTPWGQAVARCGARRASLVVCGPGLLPHMGLNR